MRWRLGGATLTCALALAACGNADVPGDVMDAFDTGDEATAYHLALDLTAIEQDIEIESRQVAQLRILTRFRRQLWR
ncbi:MAG: hypothetical protein M3487_06510 [Actinomycetota bacterium]|nr:hypothetical protein [Acidimicrobiia bacterium]MDQ3469400.1 hypothetical protein [Actinomycetota bacterium]